MNKPIIYIGVIVLLAAVGICLFALTAHDGTDGGNATVNTTNEMAIVAASPKIVVDGSWELSGPGPVWKLYTADDGTIYSFQGQHGNTIRAISPDGSIEWTYQVPDEWRVSNVVSSTVGFLLGIPNYIGPVYSIENDVLYLYVRENKTTDFNHYPYESYEDNGQSSYLLKERLMAISGGKLLWDVPLSDEHHYFEDSSVNAQNGRIYVFDDYSVSVFNASGSQLFRIDNASAPPAVDENGGIFVVPAVPSKNPIILDLYKSPQDTVHKGPANIVQGYSSDGTLVWETDVGTPIIPISMAPLGSGENTIPLYKDHTLYVEVGLDVKALGTNGTVMWSANINDLLPHGIISPENHTYYYTKESPGYPAMAWAGTGMGNTSLTLSIPSSANITAFQPYTGVDLWGVDIPLNGTIVTMDAGNAEKLLSRHRLLLNTPAGPDTASGNPAIASHVYEKDYGSLASKDTVYSYAVFIDYEQPVIINQSKCYYASVLCAFDKSNGKLIWYKPQDAIVTSMAVGDDKFYYGTRDGRIFGGITRDKPAPAIVAAALQDDLGKVAGVVAGGASVTAAAVLFIKMFALGGLTRARGQLTKNDNRNRVLEYIVSHPGSTMYEISHGLGLNVGTIRYHLLILSLNHRVATFQSDGKYVRYFTNAGSYSKDEQFYLSLVRRDPMRRILDLLIDKAEMSNQEISEALDMHDSASSRYLKELAARGLVLKRDATGGRTAYSIRHEYRDPIATALERIDNN